MSINDPYEICYNEKREAYFVMQGRETFYDENNVWILFDTIGEAQKWIDEQESLE